MQFLLLGELTALRDGTPLDLGGPLPRALLALLLTEVGRPVSADRITDELWGETPPEDPGASIQTYVSRLRRVLEPDRRPGAPPAVVQRAARGYRLAVDPEAIDAVRFERLAGSARGALRNGNPAAALDAATSALALWRDERPLEEFDDRPFAAAFRTRLTEQRVSCVEDRLAALVQMGRYADAVPALEELAERHPLRERPWLLLMTALHASGRTADALERYQRVRKVLDDELALQPGPELRDLHTRILRQEAPAVPVAQAVGSQLAAGSSGSAVTGDHTTAPGTPATTPTEETPEPALPNQRTTSASPSAATVFVGRNEQLDVLRGLVAQLPTTGPRFVLVEGEAGIGKTRLVAEIAAAATASGVRVAWGRCHPDENSPALWPWREVLESLEADWQPDTTGVGDALFALFDEAMRGLLKSAGNDPLVVVLDDIHWADPVTLRLLAFLAIELQRGPLLIIATARPEHSEALDRVRATLVRTTAFTRLVLPPLDAAATTALARIVAEASGQSIDERTAAVLHARAGGNPFFVAELARLVAEQGGDSAATGQPQRHGLPTAVRDVVTLRLAALPDSARAALRLAAVAGEAIELATLLRTTSLSADALVDGLDAAVEADLLHADADGRLTFAHALVRETLLGEISPIQRRRLHATLAAATPGTRLLERAHHLIEGHPFTDTAETLAAAEEAAAASRRDLGYEAAARWYERALGVLGADPGAVDAPAARLRLTLALGTAYADAGIQHRALEHLHAAIELALAVGEPAAGAAAVAAIGRTGGFWMWVPYGTYPEDALGRLQSLLDALGPADSAARVRVLSVLAVGSHYGPDRTLGDQLSAEALAMARRLGDDLLVVEALAARLLCLWLPARQDEQIAVATELIERADDRDCAPYRLIGLLRRSLLRLEVLDTDGSGTDLQTAWQLAEKRRLPLYQVQLVQTQAARAALAGELDVAEELVARATALSERTHIYLQNWTLMLMTVVIRYEQGRLGELLPLLEEQSAAEPVTNGDLLAALILCHAGRRDEAAAVMAANNGYRLCPMEWDFVAITCWQAIIAGDLGATDEATGLLDRLRPHVGTLAQHGAVGMLGPVGLYAGRMALLAGEMDEAEKLLRDAVAVCEEHGFRPAYAHATVWLAATLRERGDHDAARTWAAAAAEMATALGMRRVAAHAADLLA